MPGQLQAAAGGGCAGRRGSRLGGRVGGLPPPPRPAPLLPPSASSLSYLPARTPPVRALAPRGGIFLNLGTGMQRPGGFSPCLRIAYSLWSGWKWTFPACCIGLRYCTKAREWATAPTNARLRAQVLIRHLASLLCQSLMFILLQSSSCGSSALFLFVARVCIIWIFKFM